MTTLVDEKLHGCSNFDEQKINCRKRITMYFILQKKVTK